MSKKTVTPAKQEAESHAKMTPAEVSTVVALETDRDAHLRELDELKLSLFEPPDTQVEQADPTVSEQAKTLALVYQIEEHVADIDHAIQAAREGKYGICEHCGCPIDAERLSILPETRMCVNCKSQQERMSAHHKRH